MNAVSPTIENWQRRRLLGSGSFCDVYLAINLADESLFAVKSCASSDPCSIFTLSLVNELGILHGLSSPNIISCLGAEFDDPRPITDSITSGVSYSSSDHDCSDTFRCSCLSTSASSLSTASSYLSSSNPVLRSLYLEYMDGGSLADHLRRSGGRLHEEAEAAYFTRAVLQGLDYIHSTGIVHCDIKPQNILLGSSGIKIADFGCARRVGYPSAIDGVLRGTPLYMAPEVVQGLEQGPASDIWSLGCTLIHMLQGCPPWAHIRCLPALFLKIGSSDEEPPLPHLISPQARDFLLRCLQRDPKSRTTATELLKHPFLDDLLQRGDALQLSDYMTDEESRSSTLTRSIRVIKDVVSHCAEEPACRCCRSSLPFRGLLDYTMSQ